VDCPNAEAVRIRQRLAAPTSLKDRKRDRIGIY
jgi:hypothetical protein